MIGIQISVKHKNNILWKVSIINKYKHIIENLPATLCSWVFQNPCKNSLLRLKSLGKNKQTNKTKTVLQTFLGY